MDSKIYLVKFVITWVSGSSFSSYVKQKQYIQGLKRGYFFGV